MTHDQQRTCGLCWDPWLPQFHTEAATRPTLGKESSALAKKPQSIMSHTCDFSLLITALRYNWFPCYSAYFIVCIKALLGEASAAKGHQPEPSQPVSMDTQTQPLLLWRSLWVEAETPPARGGFSDPWAVILSEFPAHQSQMRRLCELYFLP